MGDTAYVGAVTGFTVFGLILATVIAFMTRSWQPTLFDVLVVGLAIPIAGIIIAFTSSSWVVSLLGYIMVVGGLGAITGPTVAMYQTGVVLTALMATGGVTLVMSITGIMFPKMLENWGAYLFGALLSLVFVRVAQAILAGMGVQEDIWYMPWIEYGAAVLFSLYIVYDWGRALELPHTMDNAVDSSVALFLDIINLFITLLQIFASSDSSDSSD
jgi:FtsH-binding integral membrane protein